MSRQVFVGKENRAGKDHVPFLPPVLPEDYNQILAGTGRGPGGPAVTTALAGEGTT